MKHGKLLFHYLHFLANLFSSFFWGFEIEKPSAKYYGHIWNILSIAHFWQIKIENS